MAVMTMIIKRWLNTAPFLSRLLLNIPSINSMKINHFNTSYFAPFTTVNLLNFVNKNILYALRLTFLPYDLAYLSLIKDLFMTH